MISTGWKLLSYNIQLAILSMKFLAEQLEQLQKQKQQTEDRIRELEKKQEGQLKQWQKDKIAAELIELRTVLSETNTKIQNNPKPITKEQLFALLPWCDV